MRILLFAFILFLAACQTAQEEPGTDATPADTTMSMTDSDGWTELTADHWRGYNKDSIPSAWIVMEDGTFHFTGEGEGGDIITRGMYDDFELMLEWKISEGGNSGIMFRVNEEHDYPWRTGPEYQILDNDNHPDAQEGGDRLAGANYDMHEPSEDAVNPVGEWNTARIVVSGANVEHWLNDVMIVSYELWSDDWNERIAGSKWIDMPSYGMEQMGHICLQDHGDHVWFRNIKVRALEMETFHEPDPASE